MEALAQQLRDETGVAVDILQADLTDSGDLAKVEVRLRENHKIGILVSNPGKPGGNRCSAVIQIFMVEQWPTSRRSSSGAYQ